MSQRGDEEAAAAVGAECTPRPQVAAIGGPIASAQPDYTPLSAARSTASEPPGVPPEEVVATRAGEVLLPHTLLKVPGLPVYGLAIPTVSGLRLVLDQLGAAKRRRKVLWHNMREEPVLYINGKPYVVREADKPFANLEYTGIDRWRVEGMEARLKQDVLHEAEQYDHQILVAHEDDQFQVVQQWEPVTEVDVQTPLEVYRELLADGYDVDYLRVPVTDEKAPKAGRDRDFELLIQRCWAPPESAALVFNCQMGRGRTTTGMVIGSLLFLRRLSPTLRPPPEPAPGLPDWFVASQDVTSPTKAGLSVLEESELKAGKFGVIRSLLRVLERGVQAKAALDCVLDACAAMQNLREAIASYRTRIYYEASDARRTSLLHVCLEYLERYFVLVAFAAYLGGGGFQPGTPSHASFSEWSAHRPELRSILDRLLRLNPLAALGLHRAPDALAGGEAQETADRREGEQRAALLARRGGAVLGPHTLLKEDHFPGCQSARLAPLFPGAPNFREVPGVRVFGGAIATVQGMRDVLQHVGAAPDSPGNNGWQASRTAVHGPELRSCPGGPPRVQAVWHLMREEPVVYINGRPYASRPFKNLMEYRGIVPARLEQMESRLRDDVIQEAADHGGRVLVTVEQSVEGWKAGARNVRDILEPVEGPHAVQTPRQVYEMLQSEGYRVQYVRVPLTDGTAPKPSDFDSFYSSAAAAGPSDALIYTCQLGGGRTTAGTAIGTLLRMHLNGATLCENMDAASSMELALSSLGNLDEDVGGASPRGESEDDEERLPSGEAAAAAAAAAAGGDGGRAAASGVDGAAVATPRGGGAPTGVLAAAAAATLGRRTAAYARQPSLPEAEGVLPLDLEARNMQNGEYVAVRRFVRILEGGADAKATVDQVVDVCGLVINLRTSIMRYRKPKSVDKFFRAELHTRHSAFQRGSSYLERYCLLITFTAYLRLCQRRGRRMTFEEWMAARPDARDAIHQNPAGALAPLPVVLPLTPAPTAATPQAAVGRDVGPEEQRQVLLRRRGSTVGRRSILKSFMLGGASRCAEALRVDGVTELRQAEGLPVFALGNASVEGLRRLLAALGALPSGRTHVVVTDLREELVLYVNGTAYLRRELEMPAAALHHAGIQAVKLEDLERRLRADMAAEAAAWGGKVLLHREVASTARAGGGGGGGLPGLRTPAGAPPPAADAGRASPAQAQAAQAAGQGPPPAAAAGAAAAGGEDALEITRTTDYQAAPEVQAFWEATGVSGDVDTGLCTPSEVFVAVAAEGYQVSYRRVPMSRERTPQVAYVFLSRTAAGSSARFAAAFACAYLAAKAGAASPSKTPAAVGVGAGAGASPTWAARAAVAAAAAGGGSRDATASLATEEGGDYVSLAKRMRMSGSSLLRIDSEVSELNRWVVLSVASSEASSVLSIPDAQTSAAARRLGLHYLQRYSYLIAYRVYLDCMRRRPDGKTFAEWYGERRELKYLLSTLDLE
eukprot:scaffold10.g2448.t1